MGPPMWFFAMRRRPVSGLHAETLLRKWGKQTPQLLPSRAPTTPSFWPNFPVGFGWISMGRLKVPLCRYLPRSIWWGEKFLFLKVIFPVGWPTSLRPTGTCGMCFYPNAPARPSLSKSKTFMIRRKLNEILRALLRRSRRTGGQFGGVGRGPGSFCHGSVSIVS
jgi:hypothetical protein